MDDVYELYKPLRNNLRKLELSMSLVGIHAHMQFQQFKVPLPGYIIGEPVGYRNCKTLYDFIGFYLMPWELALLCVELIINADGYDKNKSFLNWYYLRSSVNRLKDLENGIDSIYTTTDNVLIGVSNRIPHRQFKWQKIPDQSLMARYWEIYNYPDLKKIIEHKLGLDLGDIFKLGLAFLGVYMDKSVLFYPPVIEIDDINITKLNKFLDYFSLDINSLRQNLINERTFDDKFAYNYNSLIKYPIIRMEYMGRDGLLCPIPRYLYERFTFGIYYEIFNEKGFDKSFGDSFQKYIGDILVNYFKSGRVYPDEPYGKKNGKRTVDWIVEDDTALFFVECKTKRLSMGAKSELLKDEKLKEQMSIMAENIAKVYTTLSDFLKNKYPSVKNKGKDIYPLVVTLDNWYFFGEKLKSILSMELQPFLKKNPELVDLIKKYPYSIVSIDTFEQLVPILNKYGIKKVISQKMESSEFETWDMETFLQKSYPNDFGFYKNIFIKKLPLFNK